MFVLFEMRKSDWWKGSRHKYLLVAPLSDVNAGISQEFTLLYNFDSKKLIRCKRRAIKDRMEEYSDTYIICIRIRDFRRPSIVYVSKWRRAYGGRTSREGQTAPHLAGRDDKTQVDSRGKKPFGGRAWYWLQIASLHPDWLAIKGENLTVLTWTWTRKKRYINLLMAHGTLYDAFTLDGSHACVRSQDS